MSSFRDAMARELSARGLVSRAEDFARARADVSERGARQFQALEKILGARRRDAVLSDINRRYAIDDCIRVLGFGELLTEYLIAPLAPPEDVRRPVCDLGVLANFIVTYFDRLADQGFDVETLLGRDLLTSHGAPIDGSHPVERLVGCYFSSLAALPLRADATSVLLLVRRTIVRMYDAEVATVRQAGRCSPLVLRRKSALPFVVMALPASACGGTRPLSRKYLRWLFAVGDLLGWIDDAVDIDLDRANEHANRLTRHEPHDVALRISDRAQNIFAAWNTCVGPRNGNAFVRNALATCITSWLGETRAD